MERKGKTAAPRGNRLARGGDRRRALVLAGMATVVAGGGVFLARRLRGSRKNRRDSRPTTAEESTRLAEKFILVDGIKMHYLASLGEPAIDVPTILVHGLALSSRYMIPTADLLARTHRVYVPDLPGFGDSDKPGRVLDVGGLADALADWMEAAGIGRAVLLGNSFGCQIIADFAARYPERAAATVLQGPTTPPDERSWFRQFIRWQQNSPYNPPSMDEIAASDYDKTGYPRALLTFHYSLKDRIEEKLPAVTAPTLVVRGSLDPICNQAWAEEVTGLLPDGRLTILPDVAHTLVYASAPELVDACLPFLREIAGAQQRAA